MKYVIERMNDGTREWWDGSDWSDVDTDADWFDNRAEAERVADIRGGSATGFEFDSQQHRGDGR